MESVVWFAGVDVGSVTVKVVITGNGEIQAYRLISAGSNHRVAVQKAMEEALADSGLCLKSIANTVATGYGASNVDFASHRVTDISCCARGISHEFPKVRTVIDVGGQASKVIRVNAEGRATDFLISERCAAGSGRFLQIIANVLRVDLDSVGPLSLQAANPITYTTGCAVFGESEAVSRVAEGIAKEDILAGVHNSIAAKISNLIDRVGLEQECAFTGGGALDIGLIKRMEEKLTVRLSVPGQPQITAALGAALLAKEKMTGSTHRS
ncbi:acyl-CoA dehydratase activase [Chloroflexota bacterium]